MQLSKVESEGVLGVYIDSHLTWNEHIDMLRRKLLQRIAILGRARRYLPTKYRLLLYNASIKPIFTYCCTVWSNCSQGCRDGAVVRALASHQCGPGSIPRLSVICGLSLLVLYSAPRGFLRVLRFLLSSKTNI